MASLDSTLFGLKQGKTKLFWDEGEAEIKKKINKKKRGVDAQKLLTLSVYDV